MTERATLAQQRDELDCIARERAASIETREQIGKTAPEILKMQRLRLAVLHDAHRTLDWLTANAAAFRAYIKGTNP